MGDKDRKSYLRKKIIFFWGRKGASVTILLAQRLPLRYLYFFAEVVGRVGFYLMRRRKRIAYNNLKLAFGTSKTKREYLEITKTIFRDTVKNGLEAAKIVYADPNLIKEIVSIEGREHLDNALGQGKGVVAISAHLGNFLIIGPRLIAEGYPFNTHHLFYKVRASVHNLGCFQSIFCCVMENGFCDFKVFSFRF